MNSFTRSSCMLRLAVLFSMVACLHSFTLTTRTQRSRRSLLPAAAAGVELTAEPKGGKELTAQVTVSSNSRMKEMSKIEEKSTFGEERFVFWMTSQAEGELIKSLRAQVLRDAAKKANFPGFRKGQVPPYAQPQITLFAVQEALIKTVESVIEAFGLESLPGSDGKVEILEDVDALAKLYKTGDTIAFTATVNCTYGEDKSVIEAAVDDAIETSAETMDE